MIGDGQRVGSRYVAFRASPGRETIRTDRADKRERRDSGEIVLQGHGGKQCFERHFISPINRFAWPILSYCLSAARHGRHSVQEVKDTDACPYSSPAISRAMGIFSATFQATRRGKVLRGSGCRDLHAIAGWPGRVVNRRLNDCAVPANSLVLRSSALARIVKRTWRKALRPRSQRDRFGGQQAQAPEDRCWPKPIPTAGTTVRRRAAGTGAGLFGRPCPVLHGQHRKTGAPAATGRTAVPQPIFGNRNRILRAGIRRSRAEPGLAAPYGGSLGMVIDRASSLHDHVEILRYMTADAERMQNLV